MARVVLLVEDDLDLQRIYSEKLGNAGFKVLLTSDASQAATILKNEVVSLILLDIMIPGKMNGFEFLKYLKENESTTKIPVLVLTNLDTEKEEALKMGAVDYIVKANVDINQVVEKVKSFAS